MKNCIENKMKEEWRPVRGFEEYAEVSNLGQIHYYATGRGRYPDERWTYGCERTDGYLNAEIGGINKGVHQWVYMTFNDCDIPKGYDVNHLDENKRNNRLDNLNLLSYGDNMRYGTGIARSAASRRGKKRPSEVVAKVAAALRGKKRSEEAKARMSVAQKNNSKKSKTVQALDKDGNVVMEFPSTAEAQRHGFNSGAVSQCCNGKLKLYKGFIWCYAKI